MCVYCLLGSALSVNWAERTKNAMASGPASAQTVPDGTVGTATTTVEARRDAEDQSDVTSS